MTFLELHDPDPDPDPQPSPLTFLGLQDPGQDPAPPLPACPYPLPRLEHLSLENFGGDVRQVSALTSLTSLELRGCRWVPGALLVCGGGRRVLGALRVWGGCRWVPGALLVCGGGRWVLGVCLNIYHVADSFYQIRPKYNQTVCIPPIPIPPYFSFS